MNQLQSTTKRSTIIIGMILSFALILFAVLFFSPLLKLTNISITNIFFLSRLFIWLSLILIYIYVVKVEKQNFLLWNDKKYSFIYYLVSILLIMLAMFVAMMLTSLIVKLFGFNTASNKLNEVAQILHDNKLLLVFTALTAGITEELIFRGYLLTRLQFLLKNKILAIIISAVLFGMVHISFGTIHQIIGPIFIGLIFAFHYQKYRNIKILIITHFLWDLITIMLLKVH